MEDFWHLRYIMLLWLGLVCTIPFDLHRFDGPGSPNETMDALKELSIKYIDSAGLERDAAAILIARLYVRCSM